MKKNRFFNWGLILLISQMFALTACAKEEGGSSDYQPKSPLIEQIVEQSGVVTKLHADNIVELRDGVVYSEMDFDMKGKRQHLFIAEIDLTKMNIVTSTPDDRNVLAAKGEDRPMPEHCFAAEANGKRVWLAVNGDFFDGNAKPMGLFFKEGVALCASIANSEHKTTFYVTRDGESYIGNADEALFIQSQLLHAIGGRGRLVTNGKVDAELLASGAFGNGDVHPRTSIGLNKDRKKLFLIAFDGRRPGYSEGITLVDLAKIMVACGCDRANNLDGGGSTTFVVRQSGPKGDLRFPILNKPTDATGPRTIANGLLVIEKQ